MAHEHSIISTLNLPDNKIKDFQASAVAHATGHQVRSLPITPEKALLGE